MVQGQCGRNIEIVCRKSFDHQRRPLLRYENCLRPGLEHLPFLLVVIGTLSAPDYALFVSRKHPDGQVRKNPWGACEDNETLKIRYTSKRSLHPGRADLGGNSPRRPKCPHRCSINPSMERSPRPHSTMRRKFRKHLSGIRYFFPGFGLN